VIYATTVSTVAEAAVLTSRLMRDLAESNRIAANAGRPYAVSFTIGEATIDPADDLDMALARADEVLNARKMGRGAGRPGAMAQR
jgi:hypothetical protein